jgi:spermidine synthase
MMQRMNWVVFVSGFAAVVAQTIIIREALALFGGNELVSGILLSTWLVWSGIGSLVYSGIRFRRDPLMVYVVLLLLLCVFLFVSLCTIRIAPRIFGFPIGEVMDLGRIILVSTLTLAPVCIVFGALFPAASGILPPERVYLIEGLGAFAGGILVSFLLVSILAPFGIMLISVVVLLLSVLFVKRRLQWCFLPFLLLIMFARLDSIEIFFRKMQMGTKDLVGLAESRYGMIAVTESEGQYNFYTNGLYDFSYPDLFSDEEAVHYALLLHPDPEDVLLVGGGIGNSIDQIFRHPSVKKVTYVELDPLLFRMAEMYIGENLRGRENLSVVFGDARYYVKRSSMHYDVIIVNLPDPVNAQINRFYTGEFFGEANRILKPGGLLSIRITAPPNIISPVYGELLRTIHNTLGSTFGNIAVLPVAKTTFIAAASMILLDNIVDTLSARIIKRNLNLTNVNDYYFRYDLSPEKLRYVSERISESEGYYNSDLKPVCYYFSSILWGGILSDTARRVFVSLFDLPPAFLLLPLLLVFFFYRRRSIIYVSVLAVGASEISAEVILIVLFQMLYGYVYGWIGAIIACYMLGLAGGTFVYLRVSALKRKPIANLLKVEFVLSLYFALVIGVALLQPPCVNMIIVFLVFAGGFMGGMHFPLSITALERRQAGVVYGIDLIGSSIGALVTAMIFIPILGIIQTLLIFVLLNMFVGVGLATIRVR